MRSRDFGAIIVGKWRVVEGELETRVDRERTRKFWIKSGRRNFGSRVDEEGSNANFGIVCWSNLTRKGGKGVHCAAHRQFYKSNLDNFLLCV